MDARVHQSKRTFLFVGHALLLVVVACHLTDRAYPRGEAPSVGLRGQAPRGGGPETRCSCASVGVNPLPRPFSPRKDSKTKVLHVYPPVRYVLSRWSGQPGSAQAELLAFPNLPGPAQALSPSQSRPERLSGAKGGEASGRRACRARPEADVPTLLQVRGSLFTSVVAIAIR